MNESLTVYPVIRKYVNRLALPATLPNEVALVSTLARIPEPRSDGQEAGVD